MLRFLAKLGYKRLFLVILLIAISSLFRVILYQSLEYQYPPKNGFGDLENSLQRNIHLSWPHDANLHTSGAYFPTVASIT